MAQLHKSGESKPYVMLLTLVATFGGLLFGYDTAVISGAVQSLQSFFIDPLANDPQLALSVILQYRITVAVVTAIVLYTSFIILIKLFGKSRGRVFGGILTLFALFFIIRFLGKPMVFNESTASSLKGFTISSALVGCIIGGASGGVISQSLGRKMGLVLAALLFTISAVGSMYPEALNIFFTRDIISFIIYRIIGGVGVGLASMLSPMYIAEIAPARIRGKLVSWNQFAIIFGMLVIYFVNYFIARGQSQEWINTVGWRYMFGSETIPCILFIVCLFFVPETPRFLVLVNQEPKALKVLKRLTDQENALKVLEEIKSTLSEKSLPWLSYGGLIVMIGILLSVFQQFIGINVVLYYAPEIFRTIGDATDKSLLQTIIVGVINLLFTVVAILSVDHFGRKPLQVIGALGMAVSMFALGFIFYFKSVGLGALFCMLTYVAAFAMSWGPVTWVLLSEMYPNAIRSVMSVAVAAQWIANLIISWTFPMLNDNTFLTQTFNHGFAYWIYGTMGLLAAWFVWKLVPETKGRTLEEMEKLWKKK